MSSIISTIPVSRRPEPVSHATWCDLDEHEQTGHCTSLIFDTPGGGVFVTDYDGRPQLVLIDPPRGGMSAASAKLLIAALQHLVDSVEQDQVQDRVQHPVQHPVVSLGRGAHRYPREGA